MEYYIIKNYLNDGKIGISTNVFQSLIISIVEDLKYHVHNTRRFINSHKSVYVKLERGNIYARMKLDSDNKVITQTELNLLAEKIKKEVFSATECNLAELKISIHK